MILGVLVFACLVFEDVLYARPPPTSLIAASAAMTQIPTNPASRDGLSSRIVSMGLLEELNFRSRSSIPTPVDSAYACHRSCICCINYHALHTIVAK
jgi:hypothetical protein